MSDETATDITENEPAPAESAPAPKRTVEYWAGVKGIAEPFIGRRENPSFWKYAAARVMLKWPIGAELTESDFDAAIEAAANVEIKS